MRCTTRSSNGPNHLGLCAHSGEFRAQLGRPRPKTLRCRGHDRSVKEKALLCTKKACLSLRCCCLFNTCPPLRPHRPTAAHSSIPTLLARPLAPGLLCMRAGVDWVFKFRQDGPQGGGQYPQQDIHSRFFAVRARARLQHAAALQGCRSYYYTRCVYTRCCIVVHSSSSKAAAPPGCNRRVLLTRAPHGSGLCRT